MEERGLNDTHSIEVRNLVLEQSGVPLVVLSLEVF
jgi:hypothetical protein